MPTILRPGFTEVSIRQDGTQVLLIVNGRTVLQMGWENALELSRAIYTQAKKAEELANAEQIIADNAILMRSGFPLDLTARPDMLSEAKKEAAWNSPLRRYIRTSKYERRRAGVVYAPQVKQMRGSSDGK